MHRQGNTAVNVEGLALKFHLWLPVTKQP